MKFLIKNNKYIYNGKAYDSFTEILNLSLGLDAKSNYKTLKEARIASQIKK